MTNIVKKYPSFIGEPEAEIEFADSPQLQGGQTLCIFTVRNAKNNIR